MSFLCRIGERLYEFNNNESVNKAREMYCQFSGSQNEFEECMENDCIDFYVDYENYFNG